MNDYAKQLKDPRWQKRRLEVMNANNFTCEMCGEKDETLHVHHVNYKKGAKPWEYELRELRCFCETCHSEVEGNIQAARELCSDVDHNLLNSILWHIRKAYFHCNAIGARDVVRGTFEVALANHKAREVINAIKRRLKDGESIDDMFAEDEITDIVTGGGFEE